MFTRDSLDFLTIPLELEKGEEKSRLGKIVGHCDRAILGSETLPRLKGLKTMVNMTGFVSKTHLPFTCIVYTLLDCPALLCFVISFGWVFLLHDG